NRPSQVSAEVCAGDPGWVPWNIRLQLMGGGVDPRATDRVGRRSLIRFLPPPAAPAEEEASSTAGAALASAGISKATPSLTEATCARRRLAAWRTEALSELTGCRIELSEVDHLRARIHLAAIDVGRIVRARDRGRVGLCALQREAGRKQRADVFVLLRGRRVQGGLAIRVAPHAERLKPAAASRINWSAGPGTSSGAGAFRRRAGGLIALSRARIG